MVGIGITAAGWRRTANSEPAKFVYNEGFVSP